jgi:serine/threonine-protein kinase RsbW/stage II sporulation protein AB (anti-sigma F factor)
METEFGAVRERRVAEASSIAPLRSVIVEFAREHGASHFELEDIALAASEALTNVVLHAYVGRDGPGVVAVEAWMDARGLQVIVCDEGIGMRSRSDSPGLGFGLPVIHRVAREVQVHDSRPGVRLHMTFAIA